MTQFSRNLPPSRQNLRLSIALPLSHAPALCRIFQEDHQILRYQFDIPFFCYVFDSRGKEDLIGTIDVERADKTGQVDKVRSYWLDYLAHKK